MCTGRLQYEVLPQAGRRPRPRVPMTALGRRGSGAPLGRDAGPTPTAAVARSKARRKSGAARRRRGLATAAREAPAGLERAPARRASRHPYAVSRRRGASPDRGA